MISIKNNSTLISKIFKKRGRNYWKRIFLQRHKFVIALFVIFLLFYFLFNTVHNKQKLAPDNILEDYIWFERHNNLSYFNKYTEKGNYASRCPSDTPVITAVISAHPNFSARSAIRKSWASHLPKQWEVLFFVGLPTNKKLEEEIQRERAAFEDVIILDIHESYINLTLKLYMAFNWVHHHCQNARFFIKVDDDVFLSPTKIKNLMHCSSIAMDILHDPFVLQKCEETWDISNLFGHFIDNKTRKYLSYIVGGYLYKNVKPDRNPYSKWYLSKKLYNAEVLPDFLSGSAYFFSTNLLPYLLESVAEVPAINLEDLFYTGIIMRRVLNFKLNHIKRWNRFRPQWDDACTYSKLVSVHGLSPDELISITDKVTDTSNLCSFWTGLFASFNELVSHFIPRYRL